MTGQKTPAHYLQGSSVHDFKCLELLS